MPSMKCGEADTFSTPESPRRSSCARSPIARGIVQETAAFAEQLLACARQDKTASDAIEKVEAQFLFEIADLPGQCRLGGVQAQRRFGDCAQFRHSHKGSELPQVHAAPLMPDRHE